MNTPSKIFIAYSRKDLEFLDELRAHLTPLERSDRIKVWYDGKIEAGREWDTSIKEALYSADIILLLVSADSISSEYFYGNEVKISLERHHKRQARVIPVVLRPCAWEDTPLAELQALPKDGKAVTDWPSRDNAYADVVKTISQLLKEKSQVASPMTVEKSSAPHAEVVAEQPQDRPQTRPIWRRPTFLVGSLSGVVIATVLAVIGFGLGEGKDEGKPIPSPKDSLQIASSTQIHNRFQAFLGGADSLFRLAKFDLASDLYDSALVVQPDSYKATEGKRKSQEALNTQDKSQRYQAVLREAERLYSISNYSSALAQFQKAATLLPDEPSAKAGISKCNTAIKTAEAKAKKQRFEGLLAEALVLYKAKKYAEAKLKYEEAKRLFPTDTPCFQGPCRL